MTETVETGAEAAPVNDLGEIAVPVTAALGETAAVQQNAAALPCRCLAHRTTSSQRVAMQERVN